MKLRWYKFTVDKTNNTVASVLFDSSDNDNYLYRGVDIGDVGWFVIARDELDAWIIATKWLELGMPLDCTFDTHRPPAGEWEYVK